MTWLNITVIVLLIIYLLTPLQRRALKRGAVIPTPASAQPQGVVMTAVTASRLNGTVASPAALPQSPTAGAAGHLPKSPGSPFLSLPLGDATGEPGQHSEKARLTL